MSTPAKHPNGRGLTLEEKRHRIRQNAPTQQSCGTTMQTSGVGTFDQPDCFMFGYVFTEQPKMHYGAEVVGFDPTSDTAPVSQGYVSEWFINADGHYEGAYVGARVLDGPKNATVTHHFHFNATAMKGVSVAPSVVNTTPPTVINPADGTGSLAGVNAGTLGDGQPPASSPTATVLGGIGSLFITWQPVANSSPVSYEVHVATTNANAPSAADLVGTSTSGMLNVTKDASGNPLVAYQPNVTPQTPSTYYVALVAKDVDGTAPPSAWVGPYAPKTATTTDIDANWVYANGVLASQIETATMNAVLTLSGQIIAGQGGNPPISSVVMDSNGIHVYDSNGNLTTDINANGTDRFNGIVDAQSLVVESGGATFNGPVQLPTGQTMTADGTIVLTGSPAVGPGTRTPSASVGQQGYAGLSSPGSAWNSFKLGENAAGSGMLVYACFQNSGGNWFEVRTLSNAGVVGSSATVTFHDTSAAYAQTVYGGGQVGGTYYWLVKNNNDGNFYWIGSNGSSTSVTAVKYTSGQGGGFITPSNVALGSGDGTNLYVLTYTGGQPNCYQYTAGQAVANSFVTLGVPSGYQPVAFYAGTTPMGTRHLIGQNVSGSYIVRSSTYAGTYQASEDFYMTDVTGIAYDGTYLWGGGWQSSARSENGTNWTSPTGPSQTWYISMSYMTPGTGQTSSAPGSQESLPSANPASFTMNRRSRISVSVQANASYDIAIYMGTSTGSLHYQGYIPAGSTSMVLTSLNTTNASPRTTSTMPTQSPGQIHSGDGGLVIRGDGFFQVASSGNAVGLGNPTVYADTGQTYIRDPGNAGCFVRVQSNTVTISGAMSGGSNWTTSGTIQGGVVTSTGALNGTSVQSSGTGNSQFAGQVTATQFLTTAAATTTGTVAVIASNGVIAKQSSSRRYKKFIRDITDMAPADLLGLRPRRFEYRAKDPVTKETVTDVGFIAEEARDLGLSAFVRYDEKGRPDGFHYDRWTAALQIIVRHQADQIADLTARLEALEAR